MADQPRRPLLPCQAGFQRMAQIEHVFLILLSNNSVMQLSRFDLSCPDLLVRVPGRAALQHGMAGLFGKPGVADLAWPAGRAGHAAGSAMSGWLVFAAFFEDMLQIEHVLCGSAFKHVSYAIIPS